MGGRARACVHVTVTVAIPTTDALLLPRGTGWIYSSVSPRGERGIVSRDVTASSRWTMKTRCA